jgi:aminoglycoside 3-N-acetyltransferase I
MPHTITRLTTHDVHAMHELSTMFGEAFGYRETYTASRPRDAYLQRLLASDTFFALTAKQGDDIVGGLVAYELQKFEAERSEIYIYDLAVHASHRRQGIATALIERLQSLGAERGAWVIFVQADTAEEDAAAIALYTKLGVREEVLHFDIPVSKAASPER